MDLGLFGSLSTWHFLALIGCLVIALGFEVVNGFHDTANAVATVIYTKSLRPTLAVVWSGICNFLGVFLGGIAVAMAIVHLLPVDLLVGKGSEGALAAVIALLLAAIMWNVGTWFYGLPASSSHTLIGSIIGIGIANSLLPGHAPLSGVNWGKAEDVVLSLLLSPAIGFSLAAILLKITKKAIKQPTLYKPPVDGNPPPLWIRSILILTCTGVSFAHGSNDGQKGVGLVMLVLIALVPASFSVNLDYSTQQLRETSLAAAEINTMLNEQPGMAGRRGVIKPVNSPAAAADAPVPVVAQLTYIEQTLGRVQSLKQVGDSDRWELRRSVIEADDALGHLTKAGILALTPAQETALSRYRAKLRSITDYAPSWVMLAVALALGIGTMIGWQRIVITVGEKIGLEHLSYAQGAAAELVAMSTISLSTLVGLPVSTTHVLASGVAGTMVANKTGLHRKTVRRIGMAWVLTFPVSVALAGGLFLLINLFL